MAMLGSSFEFWLDKSVYKVLIAAGIIAWAGAASASSITVLAPGEGADHASIVSLGGAAEARSFARERGDAPVAVRSLVSLGAGQPDEPYHLRASAVPEQERQRARRPAAPLMIRGGEVGTASARPMAPSSPAVGGRTSPSAGAAPAPRAAAPSSAPAAQRRTVAPQ